MATGQGLAHEIDKGLLFKVLVLGPFVIASVQLVLWQQYSLKNEYLDKIKSKIAEADGWLRDAQHTA